MTKHQTQESMSGWSKAADRQGNQINSPDGNGAHNSLDQNPVYRAALRHFDRGDWVSGAVILGSLKRNEQQQPAKTAPAAESGSEVQVRLVSPCATAEEPGTDRSSANANRPLGRNVEQDEQSSVEQVAQGFSGQGEHMLQEYPLYRSLQRHLAHKEWEQALLVADNLVLHFPYEEGLSTMRQDIQIRAEQGASRHIQKRWLLALGILCLMLISMCGLFYSYLKNPAPLAEMVALASEMNYEPHYLFSVFGADEPVGVAVSPLGDRVYVTETGGERLVQIFDRKGNPVGSFAPPNTLPGERAPVYLSTDSRGNVYVTDRLQHAVFIFDRDGEYLETLLAPQLTLSEFVAEHASGRPEASDFSLNLFVGGVSPVGPNQVEKEFSADDLPEWSPLGIRIDKDDRILLTDVTRDHNAIHIISLADQLAQGEWTAFEPPIASYGDSGSGEGEFLFPNSAVVDSLGRVYVSDGNNGRISVWDSSGRFLYDFGGGISEGALSLPRGLTIDALDRLYVVDTVGQRVNVFGVGGSEPEFLFSFGDFGLGDGLFNYPGDIAMDQSGRLYITDRENNRVQVWSY